MITGISSLIFVALLAVFFAHMMWAFGSTWPLQDEKSLARTVAGFKGIEKMPPKLASLGVAIAIAFASIIGLLLSDPAPNAPITIIGALLTLVFLGRGTIGFTPKWHALTPEEPFRSLDRKVYSPLCLGIGACFLILVILRVV